MLHSKGTNKIWELKNGFTPRWLEPDFILSSLKCFSFSAMCKCLNFLKQRGYSVESVMSCLICLPFLGVKTVHSFTGSVLSKHIEARKDVFYRLKNSPTVCWRSVLWMFSLKFIKLARSHGERNRDAPRCLVFDYSSLSKTGRRMEKVSRMWDHALNRAILGYKQVVHLIGMYKIPKTKFSYLGQMLTHSQIRNALGKAKRCRKLRFQYKQAEVDYNGVPIKMFFSRQGNNGKWKVFITTDTSLSFIKMIEIYQIRWSVEVFFRETKQLLGLGKCQSNDFDAQVADTTVTMVQYILLTLKYRFENYETMEALFAQVKEGILQYLLDERLWGLFVELVPIIEVLFDGVDEMEILERVLNDEKAYQMISRLLKNEPEGRNAA